MLRHKPRCHQSSFLNLLPGSSKAGAIAALKVMAFITAAGIPPRRRPRTACVRRPVEWRCCEDGGQRPAPVDKNINIYDGEQDDIDRSNQTFGGFNKLSEADTFLGTTVSVDGLGKEGPLDIFYRQFIPSVDNDPTAAVLLLSGLPASSYSWRDVLPSVANSANLRAIAPDWLGFGLSAKPSPGFVWSYTTDAYVESLGAFLDAVGVRRLRCVVVQGWLATAGLLYALRHSDRVDAVYLVNTPLPDANPRMPFALAKWGLPGMMGDAFAQDSLSVEQAIEGGGRYKLAISDCEVYRRPQMLSGDAGFSLAAATRGLAMKATFAELARLCDWRKPIGIAWGLDDKYLSLGVAEAFVKNVCPQAELTKLEGAGHFAQEDFPERLAENISLFIRRIPNV
jgi:pimeloyl-ACP methyl ester carboxylesterase